LRSCYIFSMRDTTSNVSREDRRNDDAGLGPLAARATAIVDGALPYAPWAFRLGLLILIAVTLLTMPGNPVLDLNARQYREPGTIISHVGALLFLFGLLPAARSSERPRWGRSPCSASSRWGGPRTRARSRASGAS
jgi:hypothetical protein